MTELLFDLLADISEPYAGFGALALASAERVTELQASMDAAKRRLADGFGLDATSPEAVAAQLDGIVARMWRDGWSPKERKVELFVRDFGLVLTATILAVHGGDPIFRADANLLRLSIWWRAHKLETFPFHHVLKCLRERHGNSMQYFFKSLSARLREAQ